MVCKCLWALQEMDLLSGIREACRLSLRQHPTRSFSKEMIGIPAAHGALMSTTKKPQREGVFFEFPFSIYLVTKDADLRSIYLKTACKACSAFLSPVSPVCCCCLIKAEWILIATLGRDVFSVTVSLCGPSSPHLPVPLIHSPSSRRRSDFINDLIRK